MTVRRVVVWVLALLAVPAAAHAQNSIYSVLGAGLPGRPIGVHARALAGGIGAFDPASAVNPASAANLARLTVGANLTGTFRRYEAGETSASALRQTRFPFGFVGSGIGRSPLSLSVSFAPYLDRTFDITAADTITLRGESVGVEDRLVSDGAATDLRGALAVQLGRHLQLGGAVHIISGSTRLVTGRVFSDSAFATLLDSSQASLTGAGYALGAILTITPGLRFAASFRSDTDLEETVDSVALRDIDLPLTVSAGVLLVPAAGLRWSTTVSWRSWSDAGSARGANAFDTWEVGTGVELAASDLATARFPLRVGVRYAQLPFSPTDERPEEWVVAAGSAVQFASNRALLEAALERIFRDGGGASERAWQISVGLRLVP